MARTTKAKAADDAAANAASVDAGKDMNEDAKNESVETKVEQPVAEKEAAGQGISYLGQIRFFLRESAAPVPSRPRVSVRKP